MVRDLPSERDVLPEATYFCVRGYDFKKKVTLPLQANGALENRRECLIFSATPDNNLSIISHYDRKFSIDGSRNQHRRREGGGGLRKTDESHNWHCLSSLS